MAHWIIDVIQQQGYLGIVALMVLENLFPPIPSALIMPFAGFNAARGALNPIGVPIVGAIVLGYLWRVARFKGQ